ncbi:MAG: transaldolase [Pseudanabaenaceae cyanobacterium]
MANHLHELFEHGQSVWMDNLSRNILVSGELANAIASGNIRGITSNPAIFEKAIAGNAIYDTAIAEAVRAGKDVQGVYETLAFADIQAAADLLRPVYESSNGVDGYVSIEVSPNLANDTAGTIAEAQRFWQTLDRPNVMIKIPGTAAGFPAIEATIAAGIPVNVTLLFSVADYEQTAMAYIRGLEARAAQGQSVKVASVASFFLSRIDTKIDAQLQALAATADADQKAKLEGLMGKAAIANAKMAYQRYKEIYRTEAWQALAAKGALEQRLLWASTSTKNPTYSDVMYVDNLVGENTVNTMPPETIDACIDHCDVRDRLEANLDQARQVLADLKALGIDLDVVMQELQTEGIDKFVKPFASLMKSLETKMASLQATAV